MAKVMLGNSVIETHWINSMRNKNIRIRTGFDESDRPQKGFFKKLMYEPKPIFKEAEVLLVEVENINGNQETPPPFGPIFGMERVPRKNLVYCVVKEESVYDCLKKAANECIEIVKDSEFKLSTVHSKTKVVFDELFECGVLSFRDQVLKQDLLDFGNCQVCCQ